MITCKILTKVYGRDTRPVQWLNLITAVVWVAIALGDYTKWLSVFLPSTLAMILPQAVVVFGLVVVFTLCNFITDGRIHQITKAFGFALGGLANIILANSYFTVYPPLDPMLLFCVVLSVWLFGAVFFILQCEGINGDRSCTP